ncbi:MAG: protein kinase family protein [Oligoflexia bacterium]|nr:protein kinase family protein [Oligoflexia bacterium]
MIKTKILFGFTTLIVVFFYCSYLSANTSKNKIDYLWEAEEGSGLAKCCKITKQNRGFFKKALIIKSEELKEECIRELGFVYKYSSENYQFDKRNDSCMMYTKDNKYPIKSVFWTFCEDEIVKNKNNYLFVLMPNGECVAFRNFNGDTQKKKGFFNKLISIFSFKKKTPPAINEDLQNINNQKIIDDPNNMFGPVDSKLCQNSNKDTNKSKTKTKTNTKENSPDNDCSKDLFSLKKLSPQISNLAKDLLTIVDPTNKEIAKATLIAENFIKNTTKNFLMSKAKFNKINNELEEDLKHDLKLFMAKELTRWVAFNGPNNTDLNQGKIEDGFENVDLGFNPNYDEEKEKFNPLSSFTQKQALELIDNKFNDLQIKQNLHDLVSEISKKKDIGRITENSKVENTYLRPAEEILKKRDAKKKSLLMLTDLFSKNTNESYWNSGGRENEKEIEKAIESTINYIETNREKIINDLKNKKLKSVIHNPHNIEITFYDNGKVFLKNSNNKAIGEGAFKKVYSSYDYDKETKSVMGEIKSNYLTKEEKVQEEVNLSQEMNLFKNLLGARGIVEMDPSTVDKLSFHQKQYTGTFRDHLIKNEEIFDLCDKLLMAEDLLTGLKILKQKKIIHCDIKPENIFYERVDGKFRAYIGDFGTAHYEKDKVTGCGTSTYHNGNLKMGGVSDYESDLYALGVTLKELQNVNLKLNNEDEEEYNDIIELMKGSSSKVNVSTVLEYISELKSKKCSVNTGVAKDNILVNVNKSEKQNISLDCLTGQDEINDKTVRAKYTGNTPYRIQVLRYYNNRDRDDDTKKTKNSTNKAVIEDSILKLFFENEYPGHAALRITDMRISNEKDNPDKGYISYPKKVNFNDEMKRSKDSNFQGKYVEFCVSEKQYLEYIKWKNKEGSDLIFEFEKPVEQQSEKFKSTCFDFKYKKDTKINTINIRNRLYKEYSKTKREKFKENFINSIYENIVSNDKCEFSGFKIEKDLLLPTTVKDKTVLKDKDTCKKILTKYTDNCLDQYDALAELLNAPDKSKQTELKKQRKEALDTMFEAVKNIKDSNFQDNKKLEEWILLNDSSNNSLKNKTDKILSLKLFDTRINEIEKSKEEAIRNKNKNEEEKLEKELKQISDDRDKFENNFRKYQYANFRLQNKHSGVEALYGKRYSLLLNNCSSTVRSAVRKLIGESSFYSAPIADPKHLIDETNKLLKKKFGDKKNNPNYSGSTSFELNESDNDNQDKESNTYIKSIF